jgi:hypothetical protein
MANIQEYRKSASIWLKRYLALAEYAAPLSNPSLGYARQRRAQPPRVTVRTTRNSNFDILAHHWLMILHVHTDRLTVLFVDAHH